METEKIIAQAFWFAWDKHGNQRDDNGESYFDSHVEQVADILRSVTKDPIILSAAYLHDTLEDTDTTLGELREAFGDKIADLVHEVTHEGTNDNDGYSFPRLYSREAFMIKFADRLSNISRMQTWPQKRQDQYLRKSKFWR